MHWQTLTASHNGEITIVRSVRLFAQFVAMALPTLLSGMAWAKEPPQKTGGLSTDPEVAAAVSLFRACLDAPASDSCTQRDRAFAKLKTENVCMTITQAEELLVDLCVQPPGYSRAGTANAVANDSQIAKPSSPTPAPDREVRLFAPSNSVTVTGDTVPASAINTILFLREPCQLPLENKRGMFRAWMAYGAYQLGCWYPTIDDKFVFIGQIPSLTHEGGIWWESFPRALLHADGSATITEPNYNSKTFLSEFINRRNSHMVDHTHERP